MDPKTGLYSKAAKLIRSLPQEKGTAEQMIAAAKKAGLKQAELEHARPPSGPITREELARHFERNLPKVKVEQYGSNPQFLSRDEIMRYNELQFRRKERTPEEDQELARLSRFVSAKPSVVEDEDEGEVEPQYAEYAMPGGENYRERLLKLDLNDPQRERKMLGQGIEMQKRRMQNDLPVYGNRTNHPTLKAGQERIAADEDRLAKMGGEYKAPGYQSSHWSGHPDVLAHIRLQDRVGGEDRDNLRPAFERVAEHMGASVRDLGSGSADYGVKNGLITPEEAASMSRLMRWRNGYETKPGVEKRLLHVEELQSDWAQHGRDHGFNTGEAGRAHKEYISDLKDRFRQKLSWMGDEEAIDKRMAETPISEMAYALGEGDKAKEVGMAAANERGKVPQAPYVQNTQHWTDLALKNVLQEAALGDYHGVVFSPGQAQADRYGLEKRVGKLQLVRGPNSESFGQLNAWTPDGKKAFSEAVTDEGHLHQLVGRETGQKLLAAEPINADPGFGWTPGTVAHTLDGLDLKTGGEGMKGYYDNIVPKSVMRLAQTHDPDIKPAEPFALPDGYQGFHLPMTDKLRQGIIGQGFPAMRRGGKVVDQALSATRRFTKDGAGAMMQLKS